MRIRPAAPHDHDAYIATAARAGIQSPSIHFYLSQPAVTPYVAEADGQVIGTGAAIRNLGETGWLAVITVDPDHQGRGTGRALVEWGEEVLRAQGARSVVLLASERGRPMYAKMGYATGPTYRSYEGMGLAGPVDSTELRPLAPQDWPEICRLDRTATGEDRTHLLQAMADGYVIGSPGALRGFYLPAPWSGGPAVAADPDAGRLLIDRARAEWGPHPLILRVPEVNRAAIAYLEAGGFTRRSQVTYMVKGPWPEPYRPELLWGMFSFGLG